MSKKLDETFRDSIGTIDDQGHRKFIFPKNHLENFMNTENGLVIFC